jgi:nicotinate-nucleotide pyrophosphorylase (carboxylating)
MDAQEIKPSIKLAVQQALAEDIGSGDVSAKLCDDKLLSAQVICRETATLCGQAWFNETFAQLDQSIQVEWLKQEGALVHPSQTVCNLHGNGAALLSGERTALNFLQTLSGTATATRKLMHRMRGSSTLLLDTRKTIPGLREAQKYAVKCGGGSNHRMGLYDAYLIKENHITACGSIQAAVARAKQREDGLLIEVEVEDLDQLSQAISSQADIALLDNFSVDEVKQAMALARSDTHSRIKLEVSGNIHMENISQYAMCDVDYISVGAITKHLQAVDFSMRFNEPV